jgi:hypothetical protein
MADGMKMTVKREASRWIGWGYVMGMEEVDGCSNPHSIPLRVLVHNDQLCVDQDMDPGQREVEEEMDEIRVKARFQRGMITYERCRKGY